VSERASEPSTPRSSEHIDLAPQRRKGTKGDVVLEVSGLDVTFPSGDGAVRAVRGVDYTLHRGEVLGIVGESGSGKSVSSLAVLGLLPKTAQISGSVRLYGEELLGLTEDRYAEIRGKQVSMIFQDPLTSLNPVYSVGYQIS